MYEILHIDKKITNYIFRMYGLVYFHLKPKIFQDSPSHRIFKRMYGVLNIDENKN